MPKKIKFGRFAVIFDSKAGQIQSARFLGFDRVRSIDQVAAWIISANIIETTIEMFDVRLGLEIVNEEIRRSEKKNAPLPFRPSGGEFGKIGKLGHARKASCD